MKKLKIDEEFQNLIPPLSETEFNQLEENILKYGIQDPLKVWEDILIDGHNRYKIAQTHNLPFNVQEMKFDSRDKVKEWIIQNQFGRRNISLFDRICLALKLKPMIAAQAKKNSLANLKQSDSADEPNLGSRTNDKIAEIAGVGRENVRKVEKILELSKQINLDDVISALRRGEVSINLAYEGSIYRKEITDLTITEIKERIKHFEQCYIAFRELFEEYKKRGNEVPDNQLADCKQHIAMYEKVLSVVEKMKLGN